MLINDNKEVDELDSSLLVGIPEEVDLQERDVNEDSVEALQTSSG